MLSSLVAPLAIERLHGHENEVAIAFVDSVTRRQLKSKRGIDVQGDMTHRESHLPRLCSYDKEEYFLCSSVPCDDEDDEGPCDESPPHHQLLLWGENGTGYDDLLPFRGTELAENLTAFYAIGPGPSQPTVAPPGHHLAQGFTGDKGAPDSWDLTA